MALSKISRAIYGMSFDPDDVGGNNPPMVDGLVSGTGDFISDLSAYKTRNARVIIKVVGSPLNYQNADSSFSLALWKDKFDEAVARTSAQQMGNFVLDGTVAGNLLIDDAKEGSAIFGGQAPTNAELDAMAEYSKSKWSLVPTCLRIDNIYLRDQNSVFTYVDFGWAAWHKRFGAAQPWMANNINDGRAIGLGCMFSFNLLNGGSGLTAPWDFSPNHQTGSFGMSPQEIDAVANAFSQQTFAIGLIGWSARPNFDKDDYYHMESIQTALQRMANICSAATAGPWNWREHSPSGSTDTESPPVVVGGWSVRDDGLSTMLRKNNSIMEISPPDGYSAGDLHCILAYARDSGRSVTGPPSGWSLTHAISGDSAQGGQLVLFHKIGGATENALTIPYTGNYAATSQIARWFVFSNNTTVTANLVAATGSAKSWADKTGMGPIPGLTSVRSDALVLICAARTDDFGGGNVEENNMSATTGDEPWNRLFMSGSIFGLDAGFFVDYAATSGLASIDTKSWTQTSGSASGSGCGFMVAFAPLSVVSGTPPTFITDFGEETNVILSVGSHLSFTITSNGSTPITYSKTSGPSNITLGADTGAFEFTPTESGTFVIEVTATNDYGSDSELFTVLASESQGGGGNNAPVVTHPGNKTVAAHDLLSFVVVATDADSDPLTYTLESGAPEGTFIDDETGQFIWIPSGEQGPGTYPMVVNVSDGQAESRSTFTVTVNDTPWTRTRGPLGGFGQVDSATNQFRRI